MVWEGTHGYSKRVGQQLIMEGSVDLGWALESCG